jgi:Domain of unknown function (DUF4130
MLNLSSKLSILADAAKYDASCASSGTTKRDSRKGGIGSTTGSGICHSYTPDGRCVSLLKILLTNFCVYDCLYCINRRSSDVRRARFTVEEVVALTLDFYRRNYIEGLFLSSGIIRNPDYTMEQVVEVARKLRTEHEFHGYIHLKARVKDGAEELWLAYYRSIFNPARVKVHAMMAEMPKKYWSNLPEAQIIPTLIEAAPKRVSKMMKSSKAKDIDSDLDEAPVPKINDLNVLNEFTKNRMRGKLARATLG